VFSKGAARLSELKRLGPLSDLLLPPICLALRLIANHKLFLHTLLLHTCLSIRSTVTALHLYLLTLQVAVEGGGEETSSGIQHHGEHHGEPRTALDHHQLTSTWRGDKAAVVGTSANRFVPPPTCSVAADQLMMITCCCTLTHNCHSGSPQHTAPAPLWCCIPLLYCNRHAAARLQKKFAYCSCSRLRAAARVQCSRPPPPPTKHQRPFALHVDSIPIPCKLLPLHPAYVQTTPEQSPNVKCGPKFFSPTLPPNAAASTRSSAQVRGHRLSVKVLEQRAAVHKAHQCSVLAQPWGRGLGDQGGEVGGSGGGVFPSDS